MPLNSVAIIGGGPAGLMAAEVLANSHSSHGISIHLYEAKPSVGRKFLIAGKGGLNLTHSEPFEEFVTRFGSRQPQIQTLLQNFGPDDVRSWAHGLGVDTFVGSSRRVFPEEMKAAPLLRRWVHRLRNSGVQIHVRHRWLGWTEENALLFDSPDGLTTVKPDATVLALGGGSWPQLGSDGAWVQGLMERGIEVAPLRSANCGFDVARNRVDGEGALCGWSDFFRERYAGAPLKSVVLQFTDSEEKTFRRQGACVVTETGIEGSLIYASSSTIRNEIDRKGSATVQLDLAPDRSLENLLHKLSEPRGSRSMSTHLQRKANLKGVQTALLRELVPQAFDTPAQLAYAIKNLPIRFAASRPIEEAISSAGGVRFEALNEGLMVQEHPGLFCAGEMLDWEAPTGGYLLTACFATGRAAGLGVLDWLSDEQYRD